MDWVTKHKMGLSGKTDEILIRFIVSIISVFLVFDNYTDYVNR